MVTRCRFDTAPKDKDNVRVAVVGDGDFVCSDRRPAWCYCEVLIDRIPCTYYKDDKLEALEQIIGLLTEVDYHHSRSFGFMDAG